MQFSVSCNAISIVATHMRKLTYFHLFPSKAGRLEWLENFHFSIFFKIVNFQNCIFLAHLSHWAHKVSL